MLMLDMGTMGISRLAGLQHHCVATASCNERAPGHSHRAKSFEKVLKKCPKKSTKSVKRPSSKQAYKP